MKNLKQIGASIKTAFTSISCCKKNSVGVIEPQPISPAGKLQVATVIEVQQPEATQVKEQINGARAKATDQASELPALNRAPLLYNPTIERPHARKATSVALYYKKRTADEFSQDTFERDVRVAQKKLDAILASKKQKAALSSIQEEASSPVPAAITTPAIKVAAKVPAAPPVAPPPPPILTARPYQGSRGGVGNVNVPSSLTKKTSIQTANQVVLDANSLQTQLAAIKNKTVKHGIMNVKPINNTNSKTLTQALQKRFEAMNKTSSKNSLAEADGEWKSIKSDESDN